MPNDDMGKEELNCAKKCNQFLASFLGDSTAQIVLDRGMAIFKEYKKAYELQKKFSPNIATQFFRWLFKYMNTIPDVDFVELPLKNEEYVDFPNDNRLSKFDLADRKFIALANKHPDHPSIIEASDCKWWGFKEVFVELGINVVFIDENYVKMKYMKKMG